MSEIPIALTNAQIQMYGTVPIPTSGEQFYYEDMCTCGTFPQEQEKTDAINLAIAAFLTNDTETAAIALTRWNRVSGERPYRDIILLLALEAESQARKLPGFPFVDY